MDREPYDSKYCKAVKCAHRHGNKCTLPECVRNHKRILYWQTYGRLAEGDDEDGSARQG